MESIEIVRNILPGQNAYDKTIYLLYNYRDIKNGEKINEEQRGILDIIDRAIELIQDDPYADIIQLTIQGMKVKEIAELKNMDDTSVYRRKRRLIKRLSIILYGDVAL